MSASNYAIERCPHDIENPYSMINRDLIRDNNISVDCRYLLIYLLSHKDGWQIKVSQIKEFMKGHWGRDKIYSVINEAIENGYMKRVQYVAKGDDGTNRKAYKYYLSETPKFKESFLCPENKDTDRQFTENKGSKDIPISNLSISKSNKKEATPSALPIPSKKEKKRKEEKQEVHPEIFLTPTQTAAFLLKCGNDEAKVKECYRFYSDWKIGKQIDDGKDDYLRLVKWVIEAVEKNKKVSGAPQAPLNQELATKVYTKFKDKKDIDLGYNYIEFNNGRTVEHILFNEHGFKERVMQQLRKRNLNVEGF